MNFNGFHFDSDTITLLNSIDKSNRLPHAIIVESQSADKSRELARLLSAYAVCTELEKPCGACKQCRNALNNTHADIRYIEPKNSKTKTYAIEQIREVIADAYVKPNEGHAKVYIFEQADIRFSETTQNAFLKLLEEPPQNVYFILLCKSAKGLLITILSRCTVMKLKGRDEPDSEAVESGKAIIRGILSDKEYDLLRALSSLENKDKCTYILTAVRLILRDAMVLISGGDAIFENELSRQLATKFTRKKIIGMLELTDSSVSKIKQNVNMKLLTTWLCGEYRRISWQR